MKLFVNFKIINLYKKEQTKKEKKNIIFNIVEIAMEVAAANGINRNK